MFRKYLPELSKLKLIRYPKIIQRNMKGREFLCCINVAFFDMTDRVIFSEPTI